MKKMKKQTVYVAIEVVGINGGKASARALDILHDLHRQGMIENYEVFASDSHPLKDTKKIIAPILFEVFKLKEISTKTYIMFEPMIAFFGNMVKLLNKKP